MIFHSLNNVDQIILDVFPVKTSSVRNFVPHRAAGQWCGKPCTGGTWQWRGWGTTGRHTCGPLGSVPGSVTIGLEAAPVGEGRIVGGEEICEIRQDLQYT